MKKGFACLLVICLFVTAGVAESIDVTSLSTDELIELRASVEAEINQRIAGESNTIYPGQYVVGTDIKSGTYVMTCIDAEYGMTFGVFPNKEALDEYFGYSSINKFREVGRFYSYIEKDEQEYFTMYDDEILYITDDCVGLLTASEPAWKP